MEFSLGRVNHLFSALLLKPADGITLLFTTCAPELTTESSSWLLQNNSHLFFQEIRKAWGRLPKPRGAGLVFEFVACCSSFCTAQIFSFSVGCAGC